MKICMFVKNSFEYDARVEKEARSLASAGHLVTIVALLVPGVTPEREEIGDQITVVRVERARLGLGRLLGWLSRRGGTDVVPPSTAAPGDAVAVGVDTGGNRVARLIAGMLRLARRIVGRPVGWLKGRILDRRMIAAGLGTGADVFHAHDLNTLRVAIRCRSRAGGKVVYDSHELAAERSRMGLLTRRFTRLVERRLIGHADALIVASPPWEEIVRDRYPNVPERSAVIVNAPVLRDPEATDLHALVGLEPETPVLLYQGSIQEHRGIEPAIDAIARLEDVALVVIGYGHHRPVLERLVRSRGLEDRVKFFGPIPHDDLLDHTAAAAIGLCTIVGTSLSYETSLPNKLFEYLMAGIPVLGSEGPEIARVVTETGAGVVVPATDPTAIAEGIGRLLSDRDSYVAAAARARHHHHWGIEERKLLELYDGLAA